MASTSIALPIRRPDPQLTPADTGGAPDWSRYLLSRLRRDVASAARSKSGGVDEEDYSRQYNSMYRARLSGMRGRYRPGGDDDVRDVGRVIDLAEEDAAGGGQSRVLGVSVVDPCGAGEGGDGGSDAHPPLRAETGAPSSIFLEDDSGRVQLEFPLGDEPPLVTGVVLRVRGRFVAGTGTLQVSQLEYPPRAPQPPLPPPPRDDVGPRYLLLLSGLGCGGDASSSVAAGLLEDYLCGHVGDPAEEGGRVVHVIVAGNGVAPGRAAEGGAELDAFLCALGASVTVDVVPGEHDPSNANWPVQPIHPCLLPVSGTYG
eukprot:CAMPEP_0194292686 /NCGR_PEP_ID=MMETSP0169-20130528/46244_1 /TAXON_ID=218684 /ORGANISM="Corethron pennatum, Strain L29A3" /LENGTH=314 /DNA_ID=CAMNT_0039040951 /DNA_START=79 /DNA_END=1019 /DNA_ORIENTATION=-